MMFYVYIIIQMYIFTFTKWKHTIHTFLFLVVFFSPHFLALSLKIVEPIYFYALVHELSYIAYQTTNFSYCEQSIILYF